jgi:hypothetical protein
MAAARLLAKICSNNLHTILQYLESHNVDRYQRDNRTTVDLSRATVMSQLSGTYVIYPTVSLTPSHRVQQALTFKASDNFTRSISPSSCAARLYYSTPS